MSESPTIIVNTDVQSGGGGSGSWVGDLIPVIKPLIRVATIAIALGLVLFAIASISIIPVLLDLFQELRFIITNFSISGLIAWLFGITEAPWSDEVDPDGAQRFAQAGANLGGVLSGPAGLPSYFIRRWLFGSK